MPDETRVVLWRMRHVLNAQARTCTLVHTAEGWHLSITDDDGARSEHHPFPDEPSARAQAARTAAALNAQGWTDIASPRR